jgi:hypothetical protein
MASEYIPKEHKCNTMEWRHGAGTEFLNILHVFRLQRVQKHFYFSSPFKIMSLWFYYAITEMQSNS